MPERRKAGPTTRKSSVAATKPARRTTADSKPIGVDEVREWLRTRLETLGKDPRELPWIS